MLSSGKSVVEVAKDEISLELEDTGINVKDRTVTVHADNFFVTNTSGEPIAVFTTDKNGRPIVKAEYIDVDNLKVKHLDGAEELDPEHRRLALGPDPALPYAESLDQVEVPLDVGPLDGRDTHGQDA